jgi:hypothetical protein
MSKSSKKTLSKKQIILAVVAIIVIVAAYFIFNKFFAGTGSNQNGTNTSPGSATDELIVIDNTPGSGTPDYEEATAKPADPTQKPQPTEAKLDENGKYYSKDDVALYIQTYGRLPSNFITKDAAKDLGWSGNGNDPVEKYAPGKVIGGDRFGNYEGLLPKKSGRTYTECDIDTKGTVRGVKRIVFSNDGLIYYTGDHYEHFELLYGKP